MIQIDKKLISELFDKALVNPRLRMNYDLRTSSNDGGQRMLNALMPGTVVPIHHHPHSNENVILLCGNLVEILYDEEGNEIERVHLNPTVGKFGCVVPVGVWHTVEVFEPSVIYEAKDGQYGRDGSETFDEYINTVEIPVRTEEFVLPCTVTLVLKDGNKFEIEIIDRVFDKQLENYYQESLKKFKSSIFPKSGE